jgi:hypothetical protein
MAPFAKMGRDTMAEAIFSGAVGYLTLVSITAVWFRISDPKIAHDFLRRLLHLAHFMIVRLLHEFAIPLYCGVSVALASRPLFFARRVPFHACQVGALALHFVIGLLYMNHVERVSVAFYLKCIVRYGTFLDSLPTFSEEELRARVGHDPFMHALERVMCLTIFPSALFVAVELVDAVGLVFPLQIRGDSNLALVGTILVLSLLVLSYGDLRFSRSLTTSFWTPSRMLRLASCFFNERVPEGEVSCMVILFRRSPPVPPGSLFRTVYVPFHFTFRIVVICTLMWLFLCLQVLETLLHCIPHGRFS